MVRYRRSFVPGGTYFFTLTLADRGSDRLLRHVELLREALRSVRAERPFRVDAAVVLPEHLHALLTLPPGDDGYPDRLRRFKARFTRALVRDGVPLRRNHRGEYALWQRRYWEHTIRSDRDFERHCDYIHFNPVRHGLASSPADWPHSSFHTFVRAGILSPGWATSPGECARLERQTPAGGAGER